MESALFQFQTVSSSGSQDSLQGTLPSK